MLEAESYDEALFDLEPVDVGSVAVDGDEGEVDDFVASVVQLDAKIRRVASKSEPTFRDEAGALDVLRRKRRQVCATISAAADVALKRAASSDDDAAVLERAPKLARLLALLRGPFADASVEKAAADAFNAIQTTYWNSRLPRCQQEVEASLKQSTCLELLENGARACRARCDREAQLHSTIFATEAGLAEAAADARDAALQTLAAALASTASSWCSRARSSPSRSTSATAGGATRSPTSSAAGTRTSPSRPSAATTGTWGRGPSAPSTNRVWSVSSMRRTN